MACSITFPSTGPQSSSPSLSLSARSFISLPSSSSSSSFSLSVSSFAEISRVSLSFDETLTRRFRKRSGIAPQTKRAAAVGFVPVAAAGKPDPLKVMISGAPASGKGTQCELITKKYGLVHIAAGDLLRAEIASGTENGKLAKEYMEKGQLVPNEIVVTMVKDRLFQPDAKENGWLLDGYPRSLSQAKALEDLEIRPDIFLVLDVPEDILVERVVGRRLDPVTGKIYHLKYAPPETEEISARLTQRFDDTEEKVKLRLQTFHQNVEAVLSTYEDIMYKVNGNNSKEDVFAEIDSALTRILDQKSATSTSMATGFC